MAPASEPVTESSAALLARALPFDDLDLAALRRRRSMKWRAYPSDVLPAFVAEMDFPLAPAVREALVQAVVDGDTGYAWPCELPEVFAQYAREQQGWALDAGDVRLTGNVVQAILGVLEAVSAPGDAVVVSTPAYPPFLSAPHSLGRVVREVPLAPGPGGYRLDVEALERAFEGAAAYLLCSPHNPTGMVHTPEELAAVAAAARRHGVVVVADEIHSPLVLPRARFTAYGSLPSELVAGDVVVTSASKAWNLAGLKCAWLAPAAPGSRALVRGLPVELGFATGNLGVLAMVAAYRQGAAWLADVLATVERNQRLLAALLAERLPQVRYVPGDATYLAWLDCRDLGLADAPAEVFLRAGRVALNPGSHFGAGNEGFVRVNLGTSAGLVDEVVRRMAVGVAEVRGES